MCWFLFKGNVVLLVYVHGNLKLLLLVKSKRQF